MLVKSMEEISVKC